MTPIELTLLAKILWFFWVFMVFDAVANYTEMLPERVGSFLKGLFGSISIATIIAIALLPFINLLWTYEQS